MYYRLKEKNMGELLSLKKIKFRSKDSDKDILKKAIKGDKMQLKH
jgi:hypothetical protein